MLSFEEVGDLLDELAQEFPPEFFAQLNGGICLLPQAMPDPEGDDLFIMGQYCYDALGRYINLYYGSFVKTCRGMSNQELKQELYDTLSHEFTHHLESLAGERGLEIKDEEFMERYRAERDG